MSYSNTYSNGFGYRQQSSTTSGTSSFLNQVRGQRKNSTVGWRNNLGSNSDRVESSTDTGFLRSTMGSYGSRPNKQLFQSAALQGQRKRDINLRHTTGNLADILRNLNFDKQLKEQEIPKSNKYSNNNLSNSNHNNNNNNHIQSHIPTQSFRKQKHTHSTVYESRPMTSYEPLQMKKQSSGPTSTSTTRKFDIDEMFNKIKREKQLEEQLKRLREEKKQREERQKQRQRQKLTKQPISTSSSSSSLSNFITSEKFSSTFSSSSSNKPGFYTRPASNYNPSTTTQDYINNNSNTYSNNSTSNDYQQKYGNFSKKQRYGAAYTPKREYEFEKKTYQFEKKYDTAGKKQYDWKKSSQVVPSFLKDYNNSNPKVSSFQLQSNTSTNTYTTSKTPYTSSSKSSREDRISKYFSSSSKEKVEKFDCKVNIRDFRLGKQLGEGKFGTVYQAIHKPTNSLYALKKVPKSIIKSHYMIDQFILQLKLQSFMNSQYLLALHGFFHDTENIYLILDYMEQGTLYTLLKKNKKLEYQDAATKIKQISKGIIYMHENGIAHRDIKPQNVVMSNGSCKLCDFGWSTICDQRRKTYCGTFDYAAPQILQGAQYDMSVDLWCLGVMAYQLLVGKAPFYHIKKQQTKKRILNVQSQPINYPSDMPKDAVDFIERLLKKDPQERIKNQQLLYHPFLAKV